MATRWQREWGNIKAGTGWMSLRMREYINGYFMTKGAPGSMTVWSVAIGRRNGHTTVGMRMNTGKRLEAFIWPIRQIKAITPLAANHVTGQKI